jgi:hypothetical protein
MRDRSAFRFVLIIGVAFPGSTTMGSLYEKSILAVVLFSVVPEIAALPILFTAT